MVQRFDDRRVVDLAPRRSTIDGNPG